MPYRIVLNLVLLALVVGLFIFLIRTEPSAPATELPALVSTLSPDTISEIHLSRPGKPDILLRKSEAGWLITAPIQIAANPFRISSLLELLQTVSISTVSAEPAKLGLVDNPVTLSFDSQIFRFGGTSPLDNSRYIENRQNIYLIEDRLYPQLLQDAEFFAEVHIVPATVNLKSIQLPDLQLEITNTRWTQVGRTPRAPATLVEDIGKQWTQLVADRVSISDETDIESTITLVADNGEPVQISVLAQTPELLLRRKGTSFVYHFPAQMTEVLGLMQMAN